MKKAALLILLSIFILSTYSFAQLSGSKSIPGDYSTIESAIADLNLQGVGSGGVTFNVAAGHTESITAPLTITATGTASDPIVFQKNGSGANPLVTRTDAGSLSTSALGGAGDAVIRLEGTDYITFNGIDVAASDQGIEYGYLTHKPSGTDGCQFVTIQNCNISMTKGTSGYVIGIYIGNGTTSTSSTTGVTVTTTSGINSNITIIGNTIQNVHAGVYVRGSSATGFSDSDVIVGQSGAGNSITNYGGGSATSTYGVYFIYVNNPSVAYNTITSANHSSTLYGIFYSSGINGDVVGSNNAINLSNTSTSSYTYYIYSSNVVTSYNFNNNTFASGTLSSTGYVYLIYASSATPDVTVSGNSISGTFNRSAASGSVYCYYNIGSPTSGTETLSNNNFSNITVAGSSSLYGLYSNTAVGQNRVSFNNTISNWTGGTGSCYGLYHLSTTSNTIYNNNIHDITTGGTFYGLYFSGTNPTVYGNNVYNVTTSGTTMYGIYDAGTGTTNCYKNQVYNLTGNNANQTLYGFYITTGTSNNVYNNFVSDLKAPSSTSSTGLAGMYVSGGTNIGLYYNTIFLNASSSSTTFGSSGIYASTTPTVDLRNNIIVNLSTPGNGSGLAKTVAYRRSTTTLTTYSTNSNNNLFYAGTPDSSRVIYFDGSYPAIQTLSDYKTKVSPRDGNSVTENPPFINVSTTPYDLHISNSVSTQVESGGVTISAPIAITDDFDGDTRNATTPDIGADEFAGIPADFSPPNISYTPLANTSSLSSRTIVATVTDPSGVPSSDPGMPRLYWKINFSGIYNSAAPTYLGSDQFQFTFGSGVNTGDTVYYYFVARDQASTPNIGSAPAGASGFSYDPPAASTPPPSPSYYYIMGSISGLVTVGSGGTYPSLTGAGGLFQAINSNVVTGNITANVISDLTEDGTHALNEWIEDPAASNFTLTIQPSAASERLISGDVSTGMIRLNGADRVTFDGSFAGSGSYLRFRNINTADPTFKFLSGASNNTLKNCIIEGAATSTADGVIYFGGSANNNNSILSCDIRNRSDAPNKPATGIYFSSATDSGNTIMSCNIFDFNQYAVYISAATNTLIDSCDIFMVTPSTASTVYTIYLSNAVGTKVLKNKIHDITAASNATIKGIYFSGSSARPVNIRMENNSISLVPTTTGSVDGIDYFGYASNSAFIYYNSVYIGGSATAGNSYGIRYRDDVNQYVQYNNVVFNERSGGTGKHYAMYFDNTQPYTILNMDYNDYYANGMNGFLGYWGSDISDLTTWQTTSLKDTNSLNLDPLYNSSSNLQPQISSPVLGVGVPISGITTDILNNSRSVSNPTMGAYEVGGDFEGPSISYTPLANTTSLANRTLTPVTITDVSGINGSSGTAPRIYYKKKSDANVFGANNSSFSGWKWTESTGSSPFTFTIDYSIIYGGSVSINDTIQYFVVAQDLAPTPNVRANPSVGFSGTSVSSISSAPTNPNSYKIVGAPLSGTYTVGLTAFNRAVGKNLVPVKRTRIIQRNISPFAEDSPIDPVPQDNSKDELLSKEMIDVEKISNNQEALINNESSLVSSLQEYYVFFDGDVEYKEKLFSPSNTEGIEGIYPTITAAINDLNERGVSGPVTFLLVDNNYPSETYPLDIQPVNGGSATNTVTFKPASGVDAVIPGSMNQTAATFRLGGASYIIVDGSNTVGGSTRNLTIDVPVSETLPAVHLYSDASFNIFKNLRIKSRNSSTGSGTVLFGNSLSPLPGSRHNTFDNCEVMPHHPDSTLPAVGFYFWSTMLSDSNTIKNCDIYDFSTYGIQLRGNPATRNIIEDNNIYQTIGASASTIYGIYIAYNPGTIIRRNSIGNLITTSTSTSKTLVGIYYYGNSVNAMSVDIVNNMVYFDNTATDDSAIVRGIDYFGWAANSVNIFYNSVYIQGTAAYNSTYGIVKRYAATNFSMKNNISINSRSNSSGTGSHYAVYFSNTTGTISLDYNNYYVNGTGGVLGYWTINRTTLADWKSASGQDANAVSVSVTFTSGTDLHLSGTSIGDGNLACAPIAGITTDFDGDSRDAYWPYMGADEVTSSPLALKLTLKTLIEGYWGNGGLQDTIQVRLANPISFAKSAPVLGMSSATGVDFYLPKGTSATHWIVVNHRNTIETWSASDISFPSGVASYDFTDASTKAYGDNLKFVSGKWCMFSGDIPLPSQDGLIDLTDVIAIINDANAFAFGTSLPTDLNGDDAADLSDIVIAVNNANLFVSKITPEPKSNVSKPVELKKVNTTME